MKNENFIILLAIIALFQLLVTITTACYIITIIERNSVHPIYGNYKKIGSNGMRCSPWDDCP
jgi:hypothetical protein